MGLLGKILKTGIDIVSIPLDAAKDVLTAGGALTDDDEPSTIRKAKRLMKDVEEMREEADEL